MAFSVRIDSVSVWYSKVNRHRIICIACCTYRSLKYTQKLQLFRPQWSVSRPIAKLCVPVPVSCPLPQVPVLVLEPAPELVPAPVPELVPAPEPVLVPEPGHVPAFEPAPPAVAAAFAVVAASKPPATAAQSLHVCRPACQGLRIRYLGLLAY